MQGGYESKYFYNVAVLGGKNMANRQGIITENLSCRTPYGIVNQNSHCGKTVIRQPNFPPQNSPRRSETDSWMMT
jgi:hypothetical protein